jgi:hypothetical protein
MSRAGSMTTHQMIPSAFLCVPRSQSHNYAARLEKDRKPGQPNAVSRIIPHPDTIIGKPAKLNWLFDCFPDRDLVFLDDDIAGCVLAFAERGESTKTHDPVHVAEIIQHTTNLARDMGAFFYGWGKPGNPALYYSGLEPFTLTGYINGLSFGFRAGHGLRFDERLTAKADYDISLQNARQHRVCLRDNRFCFESRKTFRNPGGMSLLRNSVTEKRDLDILRQKWGAAIGVPRGGTGRSTARGYAGVTRLELRLPF